MPQEVLGINVNCCHNPECGNFCVPATLTPEDINYLTTPSGKYTASLGCKECGRYSYIKSNYAIHEELLRLQSLNELSTVYRQDGRCCSKIGCENFGNFKLNDKNSYRKRGTTRAGNQRLQCQLCGLTFTLNSQKRKSHPQSKSYKNEILFKLLVNQSPINRAMEMTDLSASAIYKKIDMFYERCVSFVQAREERLKTMDLPSMQLSSDRQEYTVNWTQRKDKRNVVISAIGTAEKFSRYVFGMDVNYDPAVNLNELLECNEYQNDADLKMFNRRYARIWTLRDYLQEQKSKPDPELNDKLQKDELSVVDDSKKLPSKGTQVRSEYTMYAHFIRLESLIGHAKDIRLFVDPEMGIDKAICNAFKHQIKDGYCKALIVKLNKGLTVDTRRTMVADTEIMLQELVDSGRAFSVNHAKRIVAQDSLKSPEFTNRHPRIWFNVPIHKINEVGKRVFFINGYENEDKEELVTWMLQATLHPIDSFFQVVRRRVSILERPMQSSSNKGRLWTGKQPYNPEKINKLLQILRTYYNYCLTGIDGKTPAEKLGIAKGPVEIRKILYP